MDRRALAVAVLLGTGLAAAAERHSPAERYRMFQDYLVRRAAEVTRDNLAGVRNFEDWQRQRPQIRKRYLYQLGLDPLPAKTPLNARITGEFQRDDYRVERLVFESMPGLYVTGNLYLPRELKGRAPAVLYVCGH
jgi:hypothetical protein